MIKSKTIKEFVNLFVNTPSFKYEVIGKEVFLVNDSFSKFKELNPLMKGISLGKQDKVFMPSLYLLELLSKESNNKVFINKKAEWLFLCGRDVFPESVLKSKTKNTIFLVQSELDENLGLGMKTKHKGKSIIKNLMDRGDFLRREN